MLSEKLQWIRVLTFSHVSFVRDRRSAPTIDDFECAFGEVRNSMTIFRGKEGGEDTRKAKKYEPDERK